MKGDPIPNPAAPGCRGTVLALAAVVAVVMAVILWLP